MAVNNRERFDRYISENNVSNTIIDACIEEACKYLHFQMENNKIDLETYNKRINEIKIAIQRDRS